MSTHNLSCNKNSKKAKANLLRFKNTFSHLWSTQMIPLLNANTCDKDCAAELVAVLTMSAQKEKYPLI